MINPYSPTHVNLEAPTQEGVASLWPRIAAHILDGLIFSPLYIISMVLACLSRQWYICWQIAVILVNFWIYLYLVPRYGGTPGKRLLKMTIKTNDGAKLNTKAALLRGCMTLLITSCSIASNILAALLLSETKFVDLDAFSRAEAIIGNIAEYSFPIVICSQIWWLATIFIMLCNKERRAIHDYIAGTVVIRNLA